MINTAVINNTYNNINVTNVIYANRQVAGAVIAVPTTAFVQSQSVSKAALRAPKELIPSAPVAVAPPLTPTEKSVRGAAAQRDTPPARVFERPVVAVSAPPVAHAGFAAQQPQLAAKPGKPLDDTARKALTREPATPAPVVKVVTPTKQAPQALRDVAPPNNRRSRAGTPRRKARPTSAIDRPQRRRQSRRNPCARSRPRALPPRSRAHKNRRRHKRPSSAAIRPNKVGAISAGDPHLRQQPCHKSRHRSPHRRRPLRRASPMTRRRPATRRVARTTKASQSRSRGAGPKP